jgi:hypothetical protein
MLKGVEMSTIAIWSAAYDKCARLDTSLLLNKKKKKKKKKNLREMFEENRKTALFPQFFALVVTLKSIIRIVDMILVCSIFINVLFKPVIFSH